MDNREQLNSGTETTSEVKPLSIADLEIADIEIYGLTREDGLGIPELGASIGTYGCCTACG